MKKILKIIFVIFIIWGCKKSPINDSTLISISKQYPLLEFNQPNLSDTVHNDIYNSMGSGAISYYYRDTLKNGKTIAMCVFKTLNDDSYLYYYVQNWKEDGWKYELRIADDTLYSFRSKESDIEFIMGEYEFRRRGNMKTHPRLDSLEIIYYDLHRDSLRKIRGNNLPPLPKPTMEEEAKWIELENKK